MEQLVPPNFLEIKASHFRVDVGNGLGEPNGRLQPEPALDDELCSGERDEEGSGTQRPAQQRIPQRLDLQGDLRGLGDDPFLSDLRADP